jgi:hypothetical protein
MQDEKNIFLKNKIQYKRKTQSKMGCNCYP